MIDRASFGRGLATIAAAYWRTVTPEIIEAHYRVLGREITSDEWPHVVDAALRVHSAYPPSPADILDIARELREAKREAQEAAVRARRRLA